MAIRANGPKVFDRVHFIFFAQAGKLTQMVNVNHAIAQFSVQLGHVVSAHGTGPTVMFDALRSGVTIPLVGVDPKRRLGNYDTAGEHSIEQPDGKQGPNR